MTAYLIALTAALLPARFRARIARQRHGGLIDLTGMRRVER